jgi:predicted metal-binding protein
MTTITICETCKLQDWAERGVEQTDGAIFASMIEAAAEDSASVTTRRHSCLMGCDHGCNIAIQGGKKLSYVLGRFEPSEAAAQAVVEYASLHAESEKGQVPYKQWPQGVKGHFVSRIPPVDG